MWSPGPWRPGPRTTSSSPSRRRSWWPGYRRSLRRRTPPGPAGPHQPFSLGELSIDYTRRRVTVAGRPVPLTDTEYRLLVELSVNAGLTLSLDHLLQRVWGPGRSVTAGQVRTVVKNLRRKLGDDADNPSYVFTEQRVGYRMANGETQAAEPFE